MKRIVVCSAVLRKAEAAQKKICIRKISKQKYIKKRKEKYYASPSKKGFIK